MSWLAVVAIVGSAGCSLLPLDTQPDAAIDGMPGDGVDGAILPRPGHYLITSELGGCVGDAYLSTQAAAFTTTCDATLDFVITREDNGWYSLCRSVPLMPNQLASPACLVDAGTSAAVRYAEATTEGRWWFGTDRRIYSRLHPDAVWNRDPDGFVRLRVPVGAATERWAWTP